MALYVATKVLVMKPQLFQLRPAFMTLMLLISREGDDHQTTGEMRWGEGWDEEMRLIWVLHLLMLQFRSDIFKHLTEVRCVTDISKWRRCCSQGTLKIQNIIRCPLKFETISVEQTIGNTIKRSDKVRWDWWIGFEVRWVRWGVVPTELLVKS